jgi:hypothetical protein
MRPAGAIIIGAFVLLAGCSEATPEDLPDPASPDDAEPSSPAPSASVPPPPPPPVAVESDISYSATTDETACAIAVVAGQCSGDGAHVQVLSVTGTPTRLQLSLTWDGGPAGTSLTVLFGWLPAGEDHYIYGDEHAATGPGPITVDWDLTGLPASTEWAIVVTSMQYAGAEGVAVAYGPAVPFELTGTLTTLA